LRCKGQPRDAAHVLVFLKQCVLPIVRGDINATRFCGVWTNQVPSRGMRADDCQRLLKALLPSVLAAGRIEMRHFAAGVSVTTKADATPVTIADHEAEEVLVAGLHSAAPGVPIIAEEAVAAGKVPAIGERFFLVDPLDGTRAFINRSPEFTINVGLVEHRRSVFGLIYAPALNLLFATIGPGQAIEATVEPEDRADLEGLALRPLHTREPDPKALIAFASRSHASESTDAFLTRLHIAEKRKASSSLKFGLIARGEADLYARLGETSEWDTAAGQAILLAAGGCVTTIEGAPLEYGKAEARFANPRFVAWARTPLL
jgi:3'(2'), 5'-bisphosphate nucleotidase